MFRLKSMKQNSRAPWLCSFYKPTKPGRCQESWLSTMIFEPKWTFVPKLKEICSRFSWDIAFTRMRKMQGHTELDLWLPKSILESKWTFAPYLRKFPLGILEIYRIHENGMDGVTVTLTFSLQPPKSIHFIVESKRRFVPNFKAFLRYDVHKNGT